MALTPAEAAFVATHEVPVVRAMKPYLDDNREAFLATAPRCTALPVVSGAGTVGAVHSCTTGTWLNAPTFTYQWRRSGAPIAGATASTYTAVTADAGMRLTCVVTGTNVTAAVSVASANGINIPALDNVAPVPVAFSPVDNQIGVAVGVNLVVTFSETVTLGTGIVTLKKVSDNSTITSWNVATQAGTGAGQVNVVGGNQLTLRPAAALADTTDFYVIWDANVVKDAANNPVAATASPSAWNFTTVVSSVVAFSGMLDVLGVPATRAYSTRRLRGGHLGPAIRIRRSNDNAELDIGFVGEGLDTAAISTFVGANSAFVTTWYDQSGTGDNQVQATVANQARIVNAGTLDTKNGKPVAFFADATDKYSGTLTTFTSAMIGSVLATGAAGPTWPGNVGAIGTVGEFVLMGSTGLTGFYAGVLPVHSVNNGGNATVFGGVLQQVNSSRASGANSHVSPLLLGSTGGANWGSPGWIGEAVIFTTQLSAGNITAMWANQATFWGTPSATGETFFYPTRYFAPTYYANRYFG
jgi:hypothetical protein